MTQCDKVLAYIIEHGSITPREAEDAFGCMRLAARISDLRADGLRIRSSKRKVKNRYGEDVYVAEYRLDEDG